MKFCPDFIINFMQTSVQSLSHVWLFATLWTDMPDFHVLYHLPELARTHVHWVSDAVQPSHPLLSPFPLTLSFSAFPSLRVFSNESTLCIRWLKYWSFSFNISLSNKYSGLISFRIDLFDILAAQGTLKSSPAPQFENINSSVLSLLYGLTLTSIHDY